MSWWQQLALRKKHQYFAQVLCVSAAVHLVVIMGCLIAPSSRSHTMVVRAGAASEAPIVFMPMQRVVAQQPKPQAQPKPRPQVRSTPPKTVVPKKIVQAPKKVMPKKVAAPAPVKKPEPQPQPKPQPKPQPVAQKVPVAHNVVQVGRDELAEVTLQRHVMEQLKKEWRPPAGVTRDVSCIVYFVVDDQGYAQQVDVTEPSGSTLYDIAVRSAVMRAEFPQSARKKEFTVAFKP